MALAYNSINIDCHLARQPAAAELFCNRVALIRYSAQKCFSVYTTSRLPVFVRRHIFLRRAADVMFGTFK